VQRALAAADAQHVGPPSLVSASHLHILAYSPLAKSLKIVYLLCIYLKRGSLMKTRIQKWGNSLALRIPKSFALETGLDQDALVDVALVNGKLVVTPLQTPSITLEQLLAGITDENRHAEYDSGAAVGNEVW
jgi:antitoxin MazE